MADPRYRVSSKPVICCDCSASVRRGSNRQLRCEPCQRSHHAAEQRQYRAKNPQAVAAAHARWRGKNKEYLKGQDRDRYERERDKRLAEAKEKWRADGPKILERRRQRYWAGRVRPEPLTAEQRTEKKRQAARDRYHRDPLRWRMAAAVRRALEGRKERQSWSALVGYTADELRRHIERQFVKGMTWENMGEWHLDHIVPLSAFRYESSDDPDFQAAWALTNLRPLWATDNMRKSAKRVSLL